MRLRLADRNDLPQLKKIYEKIIDGMNQNNICIWDEIYPCEFLAEDIKEKRLYVFAEDHIIASAFALCSSNSEADDIKWKGKHQKACYLDRLGVNIHFQRQGIGSITLNRAAALAKEKGAQYLRLFVVDINIPAINLYEKNGFVRANGIHHEVIDADLVLHEFGYEKKLS